MEQEFNNRPPRPLDADGVDPMLRTIFEDAPGEVDLKALQLLSNDPFGMSAEVADKVLSETSLYAYRLISEIQDGTCADVEMADILLDAFASHIIFIGGVQATRALGQPDEMAVAALDVLYQAIDAGQVAIKWAFWHDDEGNLRGGIQMDRNDGEVK